MAVEADGHEGPRARVRDVGDAFRVDWDAVPSARLLDGPPRQPQPPAPAPPIATPSPSRRPAERPPRISPIVVLTVLALAGATAAAGVFMLTRPDDDPSGTSAARDTPAAVQGSSPTPEPVSEPPVALRRPQPPRVAFEEGGVRFTVFPSPDQDWARALKGTDAGAGRRWELVAVLYRNLTRQKLFAEDLRFRLKNANDAVYAPIPGAGNGGSNLAAGAQIFTGTLVQGHLAFKVPVDAAGLSLSIDPSPKTKVRVPLGSG